MWPFNVLKPASAPRRRVARAGERFPTDLLSTELGDVADISGHGLRVRPAGRVRVAVGQALPLNLRWADCRIPLKCRVVWVARPGNGGREVGLQFVDASPRLRAVLQHLGQYGFLPGTDSGDGGGTNPPPRRPRKAVPDYYGVLGVSADAPADEIRRAYYRLSRQHHPDASRDASAARKFQALAEAYRTLRDPDGRRRYDAARGEAVGAA